MLRRSLFSLCDSHPGFRASKSCLTDIWGAPLGREPRPTENPLLTKKTADIHACPEWDWNPRSSTQSSRRQYSRTYSSEFSDLWSHQINIRYTYAPNTRTSNFAKANLITDAHAALNGTTEATGRIVQRVRTFRRGLNLLAGYKIYKKRDSSPAHLRQAALSATIHSSDGVLTHSLPEPELFCPNSTRCWRGRILIKR
jgi:hypothetical protein